MRKSSLVITAILVVATAFTFSCSSGSGGGGDGGNDPNSSNNSSGGGSCSVGTIPIGNQIWQKCNLNVVPTGANGAATNFACYDNQMSNCEIYGRLYDWATAMALPSSCNSNSCSNMIDSPHRGICPAGWHIPSDDDWKTLVDYVEKQKSCTDCAGKYLKSTSGWKNGGNGINAYDFAALPGGSFSSKESFFNVNSVGYWWSTLEDNNDFVYYRSMGYSREYVGGVDKSDAKSDFHSVRCIQDE